MVFAIHQYESATSMHVFPSFYPPRSLLTPSFQVVPEHQFWVPCFMHRPCPGHLFYVWQCTCFNAILSNHSTLAFSQSPKVFSLYPYLFCCLAYRVIVTHLSKFHIYALIYCIGNFLSDLLHSVS